MRRIRSLALGGVLACVVVAGPSSAQEPVPAGGLLIGGGFGPGWARVSCEICARERDLGLSGSVRIATPVSSPPPSRV